MFLYFCCQQIRGDIFPMHGKDFHPSHRGAMEDQGPGMLQAEESMRDGYHPKMLLHVLDELFYVYTQIKNSQRDDKVMLAYKILCILANRCTDWHNQIE